MANRATLNLAFFIRRKRVLKSGCVSIQLRITISGKSSELAAGVSIKPDMWSDLLSRAIGKLKESKMINDHLDRVRSEIYEHYRSLSLQGKDITTQTIKNSWLGIKEQSIMLSDVFKKHNDNMQKLIGQEFSQSTFKRYEITKSHLERFLLLEYGENDIPINNIDHKFISDFELYFKIERKCNNNSTVKYLKNFKKIIGIGIANGWIDKDPFANHKFRIHKVDRGFLTEEEINIIKNKDFEIERIVNVRDVFLFACYTGLAHVDLKSLSSDDLLKKDNGSYWIFTKRQKTGKECHIPLINAALNILSKYEKHPYCIEKNVLLPVYSNQKMNAYLKEIGTICGIKKNLSSHLARHTFATTITLNNNVPIETVSKMLGHSSINMTKVYARLLDKKVENDMAMLMNKY